MSSSAPDLPRSLQYASDSEPGYTRRRRGKGFSYHTPSGKALNKEADLERIKTLGIPPAYEDVWICQDANGHLQATGRDEAGRKQYRYHPLWREYKDKRKYEALPAFGRALPALRSRILRDLKREDNSKRFTCAALVRLLDSASLRIGNPAYTQANKSFGATTLRKHHIKANGAQLHLDFTAKGGKRVRQTLKDKTLNRAFEQIEDLPGKRLFQYVGETGQIHPVDSSDVNSYIGEDFTAKTFRTWHGSTAALDAALREEDVTIKAICEAAARELHNTPAICRSSYIHPDIIALSDSKDLAKAKARIEKSAKAISGLNAAEQKLLALIS